MSFEEITSRQNPYVTYACKLSEKKYRDREGKFRIDGIKLFFEAVKFGVELEAVLVTKKAVERYGEIFEKLEKKTDVKVLSDGAFEKVSEEKSPEGVICVAKRIDKLHKIITINNSEGRACIDGLRGKSVFILESVRDPGNLGTVVRTAAAFGVDCIVMSDDCADIYNSKTLRAAMGTLFHQSLIRVDDLCEAVRILSGRGRRVYAAALGQNSKLLGRVELLLTDCIAVGNEGHGLSREVVSACDERILIPMADGTESLNAAVAASVCLWEQFGRNL